MVPTKRESLSAAIVCKRDQWVTQASEEQAGEGEKIPERGERSHSTVIEKREPWKRWSFW